MKLDVARTRRLIHWCLALILAAGTAPHAGAQQIPSVEDHSGPNFAAGVDVALSRPYVWRGVTLASRGMVQPAAWAAMDWGGNELAGGVWAAIEPWRARDGDVTGAGQADDRLAETNLWVQNTRRIAGMDLTLGAIAYRHHGDARTGGLDSDVDAEEVYLRVWPAWRGAPVEPRIALYRALERGGASYLDVSLSRSIPLLPFFPPVQIGDLLLSASTAASFPSATPREPTLDGVTRRRGLTHAALSLSGTVVIAGPVYAHFGVHGQRNLAAETRRVTLKRESDWKRWFEAGLSVMAGGTRTD
jgi:hypothetical protein